jgi:hypothetical protein
MLIVTIAAAAIILVRFLPTIFDAMGNLSRR